MTFGSPVALVILFSLLALCCVFFAIPALRSAPPGFRTCFQCKTINSNELEKCKKCDKPFEPLPKDDDDPS